MSIGDNLKHDRLDPRAMFIEQKSHQVSELELDSISAILNLFNDVIEPSWAKGDRSCLAN